MKNTSIVGFSTITALSLCLLLLSLTGCGRKKRVEYGPQNSQLASSKEVESAKRATPLSSGLDSSLEQLVNWGPTVDRELRQFSRYLNANVRGSESRIEFPTAGLKYSGVVHAEATTTFSGDDIQVRRWRRGNNSADLRNDGFKQLIENLYASWKSSTSVETELHAHEIRRDQNLLSVTVVAKAYGPIDDVSKLEATSLWTTEWEIQSGEIAAIELKKIIVEAHEETQFSGSDGPLFKDATRAILRNQECFPKQLAHSLDDWSKWIAGVDIMGENGFAIGDPNNDGLEDIYLCQPHGLPNLMLVQDSDGTAINVGAQTGTNLLDESKAALFVDLDNDGDEDLVISTTRELILMSNSGSGQFQLEHRLLQGFDGGSISAADYDNDGDVDLFVCRYRSPESDTDFFATPNSYKNATNGGRNVLLRNEEGWQFKDVTSLTGLDQDNNRFTRCGLWCDFDSDGDQDLFVVNEFSENQLFENVDGQFSLAEGLAPEDRALFARSASLGDFNVDGQFDFFVTANGLREARQLNRDRGNRQTNFQRELLGSFGADNHVYHSSPQKKSFTLYRLPEPVYDSQLTNGSTSIDVNNDGFEDVILTNGLLTRSEAASNRALETQWLQHAFTSQPFSDVSVQPEAERFAGVTRTLSDVLRNGQSFGEQQRNVCLLGLGKPGFANFSSISEINFSNDDARAIATLDWDQDGDLDIVMSSRTAPRLRILINQLESKNQSVSFQLNGVESNRGAIGAKVELYLAARDVPLIKSVSAGSGSFSQSSKHLHFGIPVDSEITKATIHWPAGTSQTLTKIRPGFRYEVTEGNDRPIEHPQRRSNFQAPNEIIPTTNSALEFDRSVLHPPQGLPSLQFQGEDGSWFKLSNIDGLPILVVFVDGSTESINLMKEINRESSGFSGVVDVVGIRIDGEAPDSPAHFKSMEKLVGETEFPFRFGAASQSMLDKIERLYGEWFAHQEIPKAPFGWLVDRNGMIRVVYHPGKLVPSHVLRNFTIVESGADQSAKHVAPYDGRWVCTTPARNYSRLAERFKDLGYVDDHKAFQLFNRPFQANVESQRAMELIAKDDFAGAENKFEKALEFESDCGLTCIAYGNFLLSRFDEEPSSEKRRTLLKKAESLFERALRLEPSSPKAVLGLAEVDKLRSKIDDAIERLSKHLMINPKQWEVHAMLGRLYYENREYVQATSHLKSAYKKRPTLPFLAADLGFLHLYAGLYKEARYYFQSASKLQPSSTKLQQHLAEVEFWTNNFERSVTILNEIRVLGVDTEMSRAILAWQLATCPNKELRNGDESLAIAMDIINRHPKSATGHELCAAAYAEIGDFENALAMQQKATDLEQTDSSTDSYSDDQRSGMLERLQRYQQKQPCRTTANSEIPIRQPGT